MGFNLSRLKPGDNTVVELRSPLDQSFTGAKITVAGAMSDQNREASEALRARRAALLRRYKDESKIPIDEANASFRSFLADITVGWEGITDGPEDTPIAFSRTAALKAYENPSIVEQVTSALNDIAAFIKG